MNNGWTITWQAAGVEAYPRDTATIRRAIEQRAGAGNATYLPGAEFDKPLDVEAVVSAARSADAVVLCLGEKSYAETPGNIADLTLPDAPLRPPRPLARAGHPVVLALLGG